MKTNNRRNQYVYASQPPFPNAADSNYFAGKALNILTAIASGTGLFTAMLFLAAMA